MILCKFNTMDNITLGLVFVLIVVIMILAIKGDKDSTKDSEKSGESDKNETIIDYKQADIISPEIIQTTFCNELQQDRFYQEYNLRSSESLQIKEEQSLVHPKILINSKSEYQPEHLDEPFHFGGKMPNPQNDERRYMIFEDHTFKKLKDSLDWGMRTRRNKVEQGGVLLGNISYYRNEIYCFVKDILLADTTGDPVFVEFTSEMWAAMQNGLDEINSTLNKSEQLVIVGWFHTHPNGLSVFMSGTDMITQQLNFSQEWQVALVMNPHTNKYRAFFGARAIEGKVVLLKG